MKFKPPGLKFVLNIFIFVVVSWIIVHILSFFGAFLAIGYFFFWLLMPDRTPCFGCTTRPAGNKCPFCRVQINKSEVSPKSYLSAILNSMVIVAISAISLVVVALEAKIISSFFISKTPQTVSFDFKSKDYYYLNETIPLDITINGVQTPINAVQVDLKFDPDFLQAVEVLTDGSFASIFVDRQINNSDGYIRLSGGLPNPGFDGPNGKFSTVLFSAKQSGATKVDFLPTSLVLANDGRGTNVLKDVYSVSYFILPDQTKITPTISPQVDLTRPENQVYLWAETEVAESSVNDSVLGHETSIWTEIAKAFQKLLEKLYGFDKAVLKFWDEIISNAGNE